MKATQLEVLIAKECFGIKFDKIIAFSAIWVQLHRTLYESFMGKTMLAGVPTAVIPYHIAGLCFTKNRPKDLIQRSALLQDVIRRTFGYADLPVAYPVMASFIETHYGPTPENTNRRKQKFIPLNELLTKAPPEATPKELSWERSFALAMELPMPEPAMPPPGTISPESQQEINNQRMHCPHKGCNITLVPESMLYI
jgi:hypothetical protein